MGNFVKRVFRLAEPFDGFIPFITIIILVNTVPVFLSNKTILVCFGMFLSQLFQYLKGFVK